MRVYRVGGAVRDRLLGLSPSDHDWCVTGATPEVMLAEGYQSVGRDFPVFLHPETREEYALARGPDNRYTPGVSIEDDLGRRDLTINALAEDEQGRLIDPHGGGQDIADRMLRHVSADGFRHDPLRVLRVARFAARLPAFTVAPETIDLMRDTAPALAQVAAERQFGELRKALESPAPRRFIEVLRDADVLKRFLPEVDRLFGVPQPERYHPEIDTGVHVLMALERITLLTTDPAIRFAVLVHDLGKGITPADILPRHIGHEGAGVPLVQAVCARLKVPTAWQVLAINVCKEHLNCHRADQLKPATVQKLLARIGAYRDPASLDAFLLACQADAQGRLGLEHQPYPSADRLRLAWRASSDVKGQDFIDAGHPAGPVIGQLVAREQSRRIARALADSS